MAKTQEIRPDHVAIYIRWSTDDQGEGTTLEVQREGCKHYALSQGWLFNPNLEFIDDGYSGGNLERPALARLRQAIKLGAVDCVVVFKIDRLSRNVVDTVNLVLREWGESCHVKSAREAIDTTTQQGKMFFYTLVSFAEWERSVIRERTWSGRMKRLQEGKNPGFKRAYGYRIGDTPGSFEVVEEEAAVVRRIFELYNQGMGYKNIATLLNREGVRFRGGREFSARTVFDVLKNPIHMGRLVYGRVKRSREPKRLLDSPVVIDTPNVPKIVTPEQFQMAQANRSRRAEACTPVRALNSEHLLTGLVRCKQCGYALVGRKRFVRKDNGFNQPGYYICGGQKLKGKAFCDAGYIRTEELDAWAVERLLERYGGATSKEAYAEELRLNIDQQIVAVSASLKGDRKALEELQRQLEVISRDYRREHISVEDYNFHKAEIAADRSRLTHGVTALEGRLASLGSQQTMVEHQVQLINRVERWGVLEVSEKKHILRELVRHLSIYREPSSREISFDIQWVAEQRAEESAMAAPGVRIADDGS